MSARRCNGSTSYARKKGVRCAFVLGLEYPRIRVWRGASMRFCPFPNRLGRSRVSASTSVGSVRSLAMPLFVSTGIIAAIIAMWMPATIATAKIPREARTTAQDATASLECLKLECFSTSFYKMNFCEKENAFGKSRTFYGKRFFENSLSEYG